LDLEKPVPQEIAFGLCLPDAVLPEAGSGGAAVSRHDGRDALRKERIRQLIVPLDGNVPVQVGVRIDESRRNDLARAVDHDAGGSQGPGDIRWILPARISRWPENGAPPVPSTT